MAKTLKMKEMKENKQVHFGIKSRPADSLYKQDPEKVLTSSKQINNSTFVPGRSGHRVTLTEGVRKLVPHVHLSLKS